MVVMSNVTHSIVDDKMIVRHSYFLSWSPRSNLLQALQIIMQAFNERPPEPIKNPSSALASIPSPDFTPALNEMLKNSSSISEPQLENLVRSNDLIRRMTQQIRDLERECEETEAQKMLVDMEIKDLHTKHNKVLSEKTQLEETQQKNQEILKSLQKVRCI
jgi:septal ring factor EnvC (AmiA/AmiB activator)